MILSALLTIVAAHGGQAHSKPASHKKTQPPAVQAKAKPHAAPAKPQASEASKGYLPDAPTSSTVLAKVNGVSIKASDVDNLLWDWAGRGILEDLILFQLIKDKADKVKVSVSQEEVQKAFDKQIGEIQKQVPAGQQLETFIREKGFPKSRLYLHLQADLLMTKIVDQNFKQTDYINVSTLLVVPKSKQQTATTPTPGPAPTPPEVTPADKQEAAGKATDIYNRLVKGEDWDKVLQSSEQSPQAVQTHGALGWRAVAAFPALTQAEFKTLKVHGYTKPIETPNGLQIFRIEGFGPSADAASLETLKKEYEGRAKQSLAQELQKGAKIERLYGKSAK